MCRVFLAVYLVYISYLTLFSLCSYYKNKIFINSHQDLEIDKTTNNLSIDKLFVISQILLFVKGQIDVFTFLGFMKLSC